MEQYKTIQLDSNGAISTITIQRPEALNALSSEVISELSHALTQLPPHCQVLIITGTGKSFVAGADISEMAHFTPTEALAFGERGAKLFRQIELLKIPVIAAVNGYALGGGCELAMACDIRIASSKAKFGQPEVGLGIPPGFSGTQRLPRLVGIGIASELIFTARPINADEALRIGLVNRVVAPDELLPTVQALAEEICSHSPHAIALSKMAIQRGSQTDIDTAIAIENHLFSQAFASPEQKEGMEAFLEKRKPNFNPIK